MKNFLDNNNKNNTNFDMQTLMNIVGQSAATTNQLAQQVGVVANSVNILKTDVREIKEDLEQLKLNEEVTTTQQETILEKAKSKIYNILGDDDDEIHKYFKTFICRLYSDARSYAGLGSKISRTKKGDYQRVIDYMEAWEPKCGSGELKERADRKAESRKRMKEQGYDC